MWHIYFYNPQLYCKCSNNWMFLKLDQIIAATFPIFARFLDQMEALHVNVKSFSISY